MTKLWKVWALAAAVTCGPAMAADMPVKAPPPVEVANWAGFYAGVIGGGGWGSARQTDRLGFDSGSFDISGGLVGLTWGMNWQRGALVFGTESDFSYSTIGGSTAGTVSACGGAPARCDFELRWLGTSRLRVGWAVDRFLPYITAGLASGRLHGEEGTSILAGRFGEGNRSRFGWTVGAGLEMMVAPKWTAKVDYLYVDLGDRHVFDSLVAGVLVPQRVDVNAHVVRFALKYRFDWVSSLFSKL